MNFYIFFWKHVKIPKSKRFSSFFYTFASMNTQTDYSFIHSLIEQGEHQQQDFKFEISDARKIARTLSAFANTDGGRLLIGVKDNGKISGIKSEEEIYMIDAAAQMYCTPKVDYEMTTYLVEGKQVLMVEVKESALKPVYAKDECDKPLAYLRIKDETILATPIHLCIWKQSCGDKGQLLRFSEHEQGLLKELTQYDKITMNQFCRLAGLPRKASQDLLAKFIRYDIAEAIFESHKFYFRLK